MNSEKDLADRRWFSLDVAAYDEFVRLLEADHGDMPKLRRLFTLAGPFTAERSEDWCNCQAVPGTANYPGPWHERGEETHYPCSGFPKEGQPHA